MRVKSAASAHQERMNLVPESAHHLQMTCMRQMRVICAANMCESCAGIRPWIRMIYQRPPRGAPKLQYHILSKI